MNPQDLDYQPKAAVTEHPQKNPGSFDLRTHVKDAKTGRLLYEQNYDLHIVGGVKYFERPCGSGNLWYESGEAAGRWEQGQAHPDKAHIAFTAPTTDQRTPEGVVAENEALRAEIAAMKAEKEAKDEGFAKSKDPQAKGSIKLG